MSAEEERQFDAAVNSHQARSGNTKGASDSGRSEVCPYQSKSEQSDGIGVDSGVNENVTRDFPGATVQVGGTKRGENPAIPDEEGGEIHKASGQ